MSISDGPISNSTGRIIFYAATMSQFVKDVEQDSRIALALSQEQADTGRGCKWMDPEWPMCARVRSQVLGLNDSCQLVCTKVCL
jgi:Pyridoxamine 5'-phosphate oxidase